MVLVRVRLLFPCAHHHLRAYTSGDRGTWRIPCLSAIKDFMRSRLCHYSTIEEVTVH